MISILFVAKNSVYKTMTDSAGEPLDCWDEERDAMKWPGGNPIVAHPPCRLFSALSHMSSAPVEEKRLAYWAVDQVRQYGGVLEHPARSKLWRDEILPLPGESDQWGISVSLPQFWFNHPGMKWTWLYICGATFNDLPTVPMRLGFPEDVFAGGSRKYVPGSRHGGIRSATPPDFARWLVQVAERCSKPVEAGK
jgi:hypothetical protein